MKRNPLFVVLLVVATSTLGFSWFFEISLVFGFALTLGLIPVAVGLYLVCYYAKPIVVGLHRRHGWPS